MGPVTSRFEELQLACTAYHKAHPEVWTYFVKFTRDRIDKGFQNYSVNAIFERIRWETDEAGGALFKVNNNYRAFYARRFMRMYPEHEGFFRVRRQVSEDEPPVDMPALTPQWFDGR